MDFSVFDDYECEGQLDLDLTSDSDKENALTDRQTVHCLFEQSGTFKNEFKKLGFEAYDYDIQNEFEQTDFIVDLFKAIEDAYDGKPSIFDNFTKNDLVMAFFPCTRFESRIPLWFRGEAQQQKNWNVIQKLEYAMKLHNELHWFYMLISKMYHIAYTRGLKMVIENPYMQPHYLTTYWCIKPSIIDKDRSSRGDYYKKPTQYWFVNFEPKNNLVMQPIDYVELKTIATVKKSDSKDGLSVKTQRSMIHPQYANRFIREFIIGEEFKAKEENEQISLFD